MAQTLTDQFPTPLSDLNANMTAYWSDGTTEGRATVATLLGSTAAQAAAATARSSFGLVIGTNVQAYSANLDALAADPLTASTAASTYLSQASAASTYLTIATAASTYQPLDADLTAIAALDPSANNLIYKNGADTWDVTTITTFGASLIDDANAATARTTLGVVIGTDVQAYSANLTAIAALAVTDGNIIVGNGSTWVAESGSTARASLGAYGAGDSPEFAGLTLTGDLTFSGGGRDILMVDNSGAALEIKEGANLYMRFVTTNGSEAIQFSKAVSLVSTTVGGAFTQAGGAASLAATTVTSLTTTGGMTSSSDTGDASMLDIRRGSVAKGIRFENYNGTNSSFALTGTENFSAWGTTFLSFGLAGRLGNVGVGTKAPDYKLHVAGTLGVTGKITAAASTTSAATANLPAGTAPTSPANGDIWFIGDVMYRQIGGVTKSVTFT